VLRIQRRNGLDATSMADSRINDRLTKGIHSSIRHVLSSSASYFVVCCFQHKIFNTSKLLNHVAPSLELMIQE